MEINFSIPREHNEGRPVDNLQLVQGYYNLYAARKSSYRSAIRSDPLKDKLEDIWRLPRALNSSAFSSTCWKARPRAAPLFFPFSPLLSFFHLPLFFLFFSLLLLLLLLFSFLLLEPARAALERVDEGLPPRANKKYHANVSHPCHDDKSDSFWEHLFIRACHWNSSKACRCISSPTERERESQLRVGVSPPTFFRASMLKTELAALVN